MGKGTEIVDIVIIISAIVMIGCIVGAFVVSSSVEENLTKYPAWNTLRLVLIYLAIASGGATGLFAFFKKKGIL